jgi:WD40 repeat protein
LYGHRNLVFDLNFSSDGRYITSASYDATIGKWDLKNETFELTNIENSPYTTVFSPNDLYIVAGDNQKHVLLFEADAMEEFRQHIGHNDVIQDIVFSPRGNLMATASWDGSAKVWDLNSGILKAKYNQYKVLMHAVEFDPNDQFLAVGQSDGAIILWDYHTNKILDTLKGHASAVTDIHITSDGKSLISISSEGLLKKWDLSTKKEVYSRIQISRNEWLSTTTDGRFDGASKSLKMVNYGRG